MVAPKKLSTTQPKNPAKRQTMKKAILMCVSTLEPTNARQTSEIKDDPSNAAPKPGKLTPPFVPTGTFSKVVINLGFPSACPISVENVSAQAVATEPEKPSKKRVL